MKNKAFLFDLDGVLIDTESQYDVFWKQAGETYELGITCFEKVVKGTTLPDIVTRYFSHLSEKEQKQLMQANIEFELQMQYDYIAGAHEFLQAVQAEQIKMGLVTSSGDVKLAKVFNRLGLDSFFQTIVSADRITEGKPHPMCYLLAAKDLGVDPDNCLVFEDSFQGIEAGNAAGMKVVGLATTNSRESIEDKVWKVIPDFSQCKLNQFL